MGTYRLRHLDTSVEQTQRTFIKLSLGALAGLIVLIAVCWGGHDIYVRWQERRLVSRAISALAHQDLRSASLAARTILQSNPNSAGAARIMANEQEIVPRSTGDARSRNSSPTRLKISSRCRERHYSSAMLRPPSEF
jgi:hypothetical protein